MAAALGLDEIEPEITGKYRVGDIRHCFADITLARERLGYEPQVTLEDGLIELADWLAASRRSTASERRAQELAARGLTV